MPVSEVARFPMGWDYGNGEANACVVDTKKQIIFEKTISSVIAEVLDEDRSEKVLNGGAGDSFKDTGDYILTYENAQHYIGSIAERQAEQATSGVRDRNRYHGDKNLLALLTMSALATQKLFPRVTVVTVDVCTSLPIETFSKENAKKVKERLSKTHVCSLNGREYEITINIVSVIMEGAGASIYYGTSDTDMTCGVFDIGFLTTDAYATKGQEPIVPRCKGTSVGLEKVCKRLDSLCNKEYGRGLNVTECKAILKAYVTKSAKFPTYHTQGREIEVAHMREWCKIAIQQTGKELREFMSMVWGNREAGNVASDFARITLVGGGAYYFANEIRELFKDSFKNATDALEDFVVVPSEPEKANSRGNANRARRLFDRRLATEAGKLTA